MDLVGFCARFGNFSVASRTQPEEMQPGRLCVPSPGGEITFKSALSSVCALPYFSRIYIQSPCIEACIPIWGRARAGTRPAPPVVAAAGFAAWRACANCGLDGTPALRRGVEGALRGEGAPRQGGPKARNCSGQWRRRRFDTCRCRKTIAMIREAHRLWSGRHFLLDLVITCTLLVTF